MQARIKTLQAAIGKKPGKEAAAKMRTELESLSKRYARQCTPPQARIRTDTAPVRVPSLPPVPGPQAETAEEEILRRRQAIARSGRQVIPLHGSITIEGASSSTLYGKVRQEISYTIRETFVGSLIVGGLSGREDYLIQTLSTEIDVVRFNGRGCAKYSGSPPVCSQWQRFELWQIADGEEYPGRLDGVVSGSSDSRGVTLRIDGPDIEFFSSQGAVSIKSGCADQMRETVGRDEFNKWLRGKAVRIKRQARPAQPNCRPESSLTLEMQIGAGP